MRGVKLTADGRMANLFAGELCRFAHLHWLLDLQSGPFHYSDREDADEIEGELERYWVEVTEIASTSRTLWRAGVLPRFAHLLAEGEWSYLIGIPGGEADAVQATREFASVRVLSPEFFGVVAERGAVFLLKVAHQWWEAYGLTEEALVRTAGWEEVDSAKWAQGR